MAAGVSETRLPLITHNTLIFLLCSYVGSNGSCLLADCGYAAQLPTFMIKLKKKNRFKGYDDKTGTSVS